MDTGAGDTSEEPTDVQGTNVVQHFGTGKRQFASQGLANNLRNKGNGGRMDNQIRCFLCN